MSIEKEQLRLEEQLRDTRAKIDVANNELQSIIKKKKDFKNGKELDDKQDKPELTKAEQTRLNNAVREARLQLSEANTKLANVSDRTKRFQDENKGLKVQNDALNKTYSKAASEKIKLQQDLQHIKSRLQRDYDENEKKIAIRLAKIEALAKEHEKNIADIEKERIDLKVEIKNYIRKTAGLEEEQAAVLQLQVDLNVKIDEAQKEKDDAEQLQYSLNRRISASKIEEDRLEIIKLKLIKKMNDSNIEKELKDLRKELDK